MARISLFLALSSVLFLSGKALASAVPAKAEHKILVERCVETMIARTDAPVESTRNPTAYCEQLQSAIESVSAVAALNGLTEAELLCASVNQCAAQGSREAAVARDSQSGFQSESGSGGEPSRFTTMLSAASENSLASACVGVTCMGNRQPDDLEQLDKAEMKRRFETATTHGSDAIADLIHPGFGRWEHAGRGALYRFDYLNPRRCHGSQKVGLCFSITMR